MLNQDIISNDNYSNQFNIFTDVYEGPIDLLLDLAKKQKVDLSEISILSLAEQYLEFITKYNDIHLEIAADYLIMAAWLTYLKSRLLLPKEEQEDNYTPEELETALKYQLQRLEAMQNISKTLYAKPQIGRDIFYGGSFEGINIKYDITYKSTLFDLLKSYSFILNKNKNVENLKILSSELFSVDEAMKRLTDMFGDIKEWINFMNLIPTFGQNKIVNKSSISSNFLATLELSKNGIIEVKQTELFGNIYVRSKYI